MNTITWMEKYMAEAESMIVAGRVDEGLNLLNDLLYDEPGYGSLHNHLGWAYLYYSHDLAKAEMHLRTAIRFAADYAPPYLHMATLMNRTGRYSEAIEFCRAGLTKAEPNRVALHESMAYAYEVSGEYAAAVKAYKDAVRATAVDYEVDRLLNGVKRCRRKRIALFFSF